MTLTIASCGRFIGRLQRSMTSQAAPYFLMGGLLSSGLAPSTPAANLNAAESSPAAEVTPPATVHAKAHTTAHEMAAETAQQAEAAKQPPKQIVEPLIHQLGEDSFQQRQAAMVQLAALGRSVIPALRSAESHPDGEVRARARHVLKIIRENDRDRLIAAFLAGESIDDEEALPGWNTYREIAGAVPESRQLYADMLELEASFLERTFGGDRALVPMLLAQRTAQLHDDLRRNRPIAVSSVASLLLVAARSDIEISNQMGMMSLCYRTEFDRAIRSGPGQHALKSLLGRVVARVSDESLFAQRFHFSLHYDLPEGLEPARQVLNERTGIPHVRYYAVLVVAKMGQSEDLVLLERMLDDSGEVVSQHRVDRRQISTQVRDIALAALVQRHGEPFENYGLHQVRPDEKLMFQSTSVGFETDAQRDEAIARWRQRAE